MTIQDLAREVLDMLAKQDEYFRTRDQMTLTTCKELERRMRQTCRDILSPKPTLFPTDAEGSDS